MEKTEKIVAITIGDAFSFFENKRSDIQAGLGAIK
jgi:hypothetical protein